MTLVGAGFLAAAVVVWWLGTGALLLVARWRGARARWGVALLVTLLMGGALLALSRLSGSTPSSVGLEFLYALVVWAWVEATFYTGVLTGPRLAPLRVDASEWTRFVHAFTANLYHEIAIVAAIGLTWWATTGIPDGAAFAPWAVAVLAAMHESARLNVLLGVRNLNVELLPEHLARFRAYFRLRRWNAFYPFAVVAHAVAAVMLIVAAMGSDNGAAATGLGLMSGLVTLGLLEHAALMLPFRPESIWGWAIPSSR